TRDLCLGIEVVLPDGRVMDLMSRLHKDNAGYNLKHLFIGAEGTLGLITAAVLKLYPAPIIRATAMVGMASLERALPLLNALQEATGGAVEAFEYMPQSYIARHMQETGQRAPFDGPHPVNILIEAASTRTDEAAPDADGTPRLKSIMEALLAEAMEAGDIDDAVVAASEAQRREMWDRRERAAELTFTGRPILDTDIAVPLEEVPAFLENARTRTEALDPGCEEFLVSHLGDGNIHYSVYITRDDPALSRTLMEAIEDLVIAHGGTFSAEHGIGLSKLGSMARRKDATALEAMRSLKAAFDPKNLMNPGKVLPAP
ncbi:MAG: FAD-binding oxidoreductase, partial [Pseudomonadota bacterium]